MGSEVVEAVHVDILGNRARVGRQPDVRVVMFPVRGS